MTALPLPGQDTLRKHPLVWLVALISCVPYMMLGQSGLDAISAWFMPAEWASFASSFWRLWTPVFIHYTIFHLLTNLYFWWYFAAKIEAHSKIELICVVLIAAAVSNSCQWLATGPNFGGLSGLVYALLGYTWVRQRFEITPRYQLDQSIVMILVVLIPVSASGLFGKFSDYAHIGGLLTGAALGFVALGISNRKINDQHHI